MAQIPNTSSIDLFTGQESKTWEVIVHGDKNNRSTKINTSLDD